MWMFGRRHSFFGKDAPNLVILKGAPINRVIVKAFRARKFLDRGGFKERDVRIDPLIACVFGHARQHLLPAGSVRFFDIQSSAELKEVFEHLPTHCDIHNAVDGDTLSRVQIPRPVFRGIGWGENVVALIVLEGKVVVEEISNLM